MGGEVVGVQIVTMIPLLSEAQSWQLGGLRPVEIRRIFPIVAFL